MGKEFLSEIVKKVRQEKNIKNIKGVIYDTNDTVKAAICQFAKENDVNAIWMGMLLLLFLKLCVKPDIFLCKQHHRRTSQH